jgi:hypothetical protein
MSTYDGSAGAAAAHQAAMANALKASGAIVKMEPSEFKKIVDKFDHSTGGIVVVAKSWLFGTKYNYLTNYKGLFFYTSSPEQLILPGKAEIISAEKIWVPG